MRREARVLWLVMGLIAAQSVCPSAAQTSAVAAEDYDTTKVVTLKGMVKLRTLSLPPAPAVLQIEVHGDGAKTESWLIAGGPASLFRREGWQLIGPSSPLKSGDVITVTAYLPKAGSQAHEHLAAALNEAAPNGLKPAFVDDLVQHRARLAHGIEITLADGKRLVFGDR